MIKQMKTVYVDSTNDTQYGSAANGMSYKGRGVGSGWDATVKRESTCSAIVNVMSPNGEQDFLGTLDVEPSQNMQALAIELANHPDFSSGWLFNSSSEEWSQLAERWDAIDIS